MSRRKIDIADTELQELWDKYCNDPRPFAAICAEHYLTPPAVYRRFLKAGLDYQSIQHPKICDVCGAVFRPTQMHTQTICSQECLKKRRAEQRKHPKNPDEVPRPRGRQRPTDEIEKRNPKTKPKYGTNEILRMAKKEGLSYGQIVNKYGL